MKKFRQNINQSLQIIKQNKLYSFFYILGTALAISMVMVLAISYNLKVGNVYPEVNRDRTLVLSSLIERHGNGYSGSQFSIDAIKKLTANIEAIEATCISNMTRVDVQRKEYSDAKKKYVNYFNESIWKVYQFDFVEGVPFTQEEVKFSIPKVVITASTAKNFWGKESALGKKIWIDYKEFTICGVVKDATPLTSDSYSDIYVPHTLHSPHPHMYHGKSNMLGSFGAQILAKSPKDIDKIKSQVQENLAKINSTLDKGVELDLSGGPKSFTEENLTMDDGDKTTSSSTHILQLILVVLIIIMVPAINLSGIISTEMEDREAEVGIRKAFGAPSWQLLYRLINENLLLSFIGGILGILFSYLLIYIGYHWFLNFLGIWSHYINGSEYSWLRMEMLVNYKVLLIAIVSCFVMNLLSSLIPQYFSTKKNIINLLNRSHIARGGKSRKRKSVWIFLELVTVFIVTWMVLDPLYVLNYQKSIYDGFEYKDLYDLSIYSEDSKSPKYKKETPEEITKNSQLILNIIKDHPFVENVEIKQGLHLMGMGSSSALVCCRLGDTLNVRAVTINMFPNKNTLSIQGIKMAENFDETNLRAGTMLISKSVAEKFFGKDGRIAEKMALGLREYPVVGIIDDIKIGEYKQPRPTVIMLTNQNHQWIPLNINLLIKPKSGISEAKFIKTLEEDLKDKVNIGSRYLGGISPYYLEIKNNNYDKITPQKNTYTLLACFVLINMFLGIFATFWLQSKKRRGEIGLRMAMGSSKKKVSRMFVMESVKMASLAALVGMIVVGNIVYFKGMFTYGEFQNPVYWAVTNDTAHFIIVSLIAYAVILLTVTLGTLIPASKAANTNPVDALRDE